MNSLSLSNLIALGEGFTTEFKRSMPSDLGREICAFANTTGGVILIGVDDAGTAVGVREHNRLKSQVQSIARSADPPVAVEVASEGGVLCVTVPQQHGKPYEACLEHGVAEPAIQVSPDWVTVTFPRQEATVAPHVTPHVTPHVAPHVGRLIAALDREMSRAELMNALGLADRRHFARTYLQPGVEAGLVEMTLPDRPRSREQRYRLTILGEQVRDSQPEAGGNA